MAFLDDQDKKQIFKTFESLKNRVTLVHFTQEEDCPYCSETKILLEELSALSDKIKLMIYDFHKDIEMVRKYKVDKVPATFIEGERKTGVCYYGIPSGYEFSSLIEDIVDVSAGESGLLPGSKEMLSQINSPIHLQVFVTPTCPHCPAAVRLAHKFAIENENIRADMIEATEFPHLTMRYNVKGVPKTIIAEKMFVDGAVPELDMVQNIIDVYKDNKKLGE